MTKLVRLIAALFALALLAAACSSDDGEDTSTEDSSAESTTTTGTDEGESTTTEADASTTSEAASDGEGDDGDGADSADDSSGDDDEAEGSADDSTEGDDDAETGSGEGDDAAVAEDAGITILGVSFESGTVTIRNDGDTAVDFTGYHTCNRPAYAEMPAETLEPGATLDIDVTELDIRASAGEFGLYSSSSFDSADAMVAYVQWGKPDNGRAATAAEAGLIAEGKFVDNAGADLVLE